MAAATAVDTETLTLRIPREAAESLRRLAGSDGGGSVENLAADLLADAARRREYGLGLYRRRMALREEAECHLRENGITEEDVIREIDEAIREVRAERPLHSRGGR